MHEPIQALAFLGNPGAEYTKTKHNAGWQVAQLWYPEAQWQEKFKGRWTSRLLNEGRKIYLLQPLTYMNLSGESLRAMADFFQIPPEAWLVIHDELELPLGEVRLKRGGGLGGHNGLKSIKAQLGSSEFCRLRMGIGRPKQGSVSDYVLSRFSSDEEITWDQSLAKGVRLLEDFLADKIKVDKIE